MTKLFKYLKRSVLPILAVIVLLVIQAFCDLSLPENISNIVNIGIQQGGVEHIAPQEIRESQMNRLFYFMDEKDKEAVLSRYSLENSDKKEGLKVYVLNDGIKSADIEELEEIFGVPMLVVSFLESDNKQVKEMTAQMTQAMPAGMVPENATILDVLDQMPEEQRNQMLKSFEGQTEKYEDIDKSIIKQMAVSFVQKEYKEAGYRYRQAAKRLYLERGAPDARVFTCYRNCRGARYAAFVPHRLAVRPRFAQRRVQKGHFLFQPGV